MLGRTATELNNTLGQSASRRDWGRALEDLKRDYQLPGNHHRKILSNGDYLDEAGNVLGNLLEYLP
jgi:filamentous hemagglutinin